jgi:hypothetical protein
VETVVDMGIDKAAEYDRLVAAILATKEIGAWAPSMAKWAEPRSDPHFWLKSLVDEIGFLKDEVSGIRATLEYLRPVVSKAADEALEKRRVG